MARIFIDDLSAAGPSIVDLLFLFVLPPLVEYFCRLERRRGRLHARFRWEDSFGSVDGGSAADLSQLACSCRRMFLWEEDKTARQISRSLLRSHPALSTFSVEEEDAADQIGASWNCRRTMYMYNRLMAYVDQHRLTARRDRADPCTWMCRREAGDDFQLITREGSGDNFHGIACSLPYVEERSASRKRAIRNGGHRTMADRLTDCDDVELCTSTCPSDRYRLLQYSRSNKLAHRFSMNIARHELDGGYPGRASFDLDDLWDRSQRISVDQSNSCDWSQRSLWCTLGDEDFNEIFSEYGSRRVWQHYSSKKICVQDVDLHDPTEQSCIDSAGTNSEWHDGLCLDHQNSVCSDIIDVHCSDTLHCTVTTSMALVNYVVPQSEDIGMVTSSLTMLSNISSDEASSSTTEQPYVSDDMDDCDNMDSSITTEGLLVRQRDSNEDIDIWMAQDQATETHNNNDVTRSTPWSMVPGFRFLPTDKEVVIHYLKQKVLNLGLPAHHTVEEGHNIYALDADKISLDGINGDKEQLGFFFVYKQDAYRYGNGCYYPTPDGYWRIRGRPVPVSHRGRTVAFKTAMDFHRGRAPHGCRTPWSMFEYALNACQADLRNFEQPWMNAYVVCKVRRRESETSAREKGWRRSGLSPRRPSLKKISRRHFSPQMIVSPSADVAPRRKEEVAAPEPAGEEPGKPGNRKRPDTF